VTDAVTALPGTQQIVGEGWSLHAERVEMLDGGDWRALIGVRRDLNLLLTWHAQNQDRNLEVEAWAGEPDASDGIAVIGGVDGNAQLARIPLCSCGEHACGNSGIQLSKSLTGGELPALAALLRELSWTDAIPTSASVLKGSDLAAIEDWDADSFTGPCFYLSVPGTGEIFQLPPAQPSTDGG
jgi:hypothetical protein